MDRFWSKGLEDENGCWNWQASFRTDGYGQFRLHGKTVGAHRVAWELAYGPIPEGLMVLHKCDNRLCINPEHMFVGTAQTNNYDAKVKGRNAYGARHGRSKLTEDQARAILADPRGGTIIAAEYGVSRATVSAIKLRQKWAHLDGPTDRRRAARA